MSDDPTSVECILKPHGKIMTLKDMDRLRGNAVKETHLARYEHANDEDAAIVLNVACSYCGAGVGDQCANTRKL